MTVTPTSNIDMTMTLEACFGKATNSHYWHYLSLKCFNKNTYQSSKLDQIIREIEKTILVRGEAFFNISSYLNKTPMHVAMECENISAIEFLKQKGVSLDGNKDAFNKTPLDYLIKSEKLIQWLSENTTPKEFVRLVFNHSEPSAVHQLFANFNNTNEYDSREFMQQAKQYDIKELTKPSTGKLTALHIAFINEAHMAICFLINRQVPLKGKKDIFKLTPLQYVRKSHHLQTCLFQLLKPEVFVKNIFIARPETYWHYVAATVTDRKLYENQHLVIQKLDEISKKTQTDVPCIPFNDVSVSGLTPLHVAAICSNTAAWEFFLKFGNSTHIKDCNGLIPFDYASEELKNQMVFPEFTELYRVQEAHARDYTKK